jgi:hypothetical protein
MVGQMRSLPKIAAPPQILPQPRRRSSATPHTRPPCQTLKDRVCQLNDPTLWNKQPTIMAPIQSNHALCILARTAIAATGPDLAERMLSRRSLKVDKTQQVTLGIIAVYVVVIALLWNIPYVRWSLWPFKVCFDKNWICPFLRDVTNFAFRC